MKFPCKRNRLEVLPRAGALYVHVPFCRAKCRYCDFYSRNISRSSAEAYAGALEAELKLHADMLNPPLKSVYVGGGTPTALPAGILGRLLGLLARLADAGTEFSIEANPATVRPEIVETLTAAGVNRVTLGAQSFDADQLRLLGRIHQPEQIGRAVELLVGGGIENLGLDLIFGIPGQSAASWGKSLAAALSLQPRHMSCYALSFEAGTPLADDLQAGRVEAVADELQREMYYLAMDTLAAAGLRPYEISNFATGGFRSRHNLTYWLGRPYLGLGPAASSYLDGVRRTTRPDLDAYLACLDRDEPTAPPAESERLEGRAAMAEALMLGLRMIDGVEITHFAERFGATPAEAFAGSIRRYLDQGALEATATHLRIARRALFTADTILADIIAEA